MESLMLSQISLKICYREYKIKYSLVDHSKLYLNISKIYSVLALIDEINRPNADIL